MVTRKHLSNEDVVQIIFVLPTSRADDVGELAEIFRCRVKIRNDARVSCLVRKRQHAYWASVHRGDDTLQGLEQRRSFCRHAFGVLQNRHESRHVACVDWVIWNAHCGERKQHLHNLVDAAPTVVVGRGIGCNQGIVRWAATIWAGSILQWQNHQRQLTHRTHWQDNISAAAGGQVIVRHICRVLGQPLQECNKHSPTCC